MIKTISQDFEADTWTLYCACRSDIQTGHACLNKMCVCCFRSRSIHCQDLVLIFLHAELRSRTCSFYMKTLFEMGTQAMNKVCVFGGISCDKIV